MQLCLFEDEQYHQFKPLTLTRPVDDLRTGILTIGQKWQKALETSSVNRIVRPHMKGVFAEGDLQQEEPCLWINSRYLPSHTLLERVRDMDEGQCLLYKNTVIAALVSGQQSIEWQEQGRPDFSSLFILETNDFPAVSYLWDLFLTNGREIERDIALLNPENLATSDLQPEIANEAILKNREQIFIEDGAIVEPGAILDAKEGPIFIGEKARVMAGALVKGPMSLGEGSTIKMGAKIYSNTTIGPVCKVGGEVNNVIFHSYSNKAHDGFMGNSVIGQWCNFGADTNISNLKNNYSSVRITSWKEEAEIDTGQQFFGTIVGDHTKTAINAQINTGTLCGICCNIFSTDFPPKFIPSFSWVGSNVIQTYKLEKAFRDMEAMMARRDQKMTPKYRKMLEQVFNHRK